VICELKKGESMYRNLFWYSLEEIKMNEFEVECKVIRVTNGTTANELNNLLTEKESTSASIVHDDMNDEIKAQ
jgi:hypothetical protein